MKTKRVASMIAVLAALSVTCASATRQGDKKFEVKERLSALQLYQAGHPTSAIKNTMGRLVTLDVVVTIERQVPLVEIEMPNAFKVDARSSSVFKAQLISATTTASSLKKGDRVRIEGMIVDEGFDTYTIYLHRIVAKPQ